MWSSEIKEVDAQSQSQVEMQNPRKTTELASNPRCSREVNALFLQSSRNHAMPSASSSSSSGGK